MYLVVKRIVISQDSFLRSIIMNERIATFQRRGNQRGWYSTTQSMHRNETIKLTEVRI